MKCRHRTTSILASFTLIELLVVVAIIAILAAMLLPSLSKARETAKISVCMAHLQQVAKATLIMADDHDGWINGTDSATIAATNQSQYWIYTITNYINKRMVIYNNGGPISYVGPKAGCVGMDANDTWWQYGVNTTFSGPASVSWSNPGHSLREVFHPDRIFLVADCGTSMPCKDMLATGVDFFDYTSKGYGSWYGIPIYARHGGRGLNFVFADGHGEFWKATGYGAGGSQGQWYQANKAASWSPYTTWAYGGYWAE